MLRSFARNTYRYLTSSSPFSHPRMSFTTADSRTIEEILPDFSDGPLSVYRKQASFDWRKLKLTLDEEELLRVQYGMWSFFENNDVFHPPQVMLSLDEQRHLAFKRMKAMKANGYMSNWEKILMNPKLAATYTESIFLFDSDSAVKLGLTYSMFSNVVRSLGTEKHYKYIEGVDNDEMYGCFALTEVAHGSNAKGMKTTATYDVNTKEFILNSPNFEAAKCWVGCLGQCATHAVVYAKLITSGKDHGLHSFVVPIRCMRSLRPFPGVIVGDIGEKIALNGVDNGFVMFNSYRISKDCLLNKLGDVDDNGNYVSSIRDPSKRFGASLGALSGGRVQITGMATFNLLKAITIAVRYSAVRKQFGPENSDEELSVIEYQQQQFRLLPYVAVTYASRIFYKWFSLMHTQFTIDSVLGVVTGDDAANKGLEIHAISSASKPITAWIARDGIQVCREACGGHGYLQATGIGKIRNENDANCTYEGENSVLIQQTSNWLLSQFANLKKGIKIVTPFNSATFLNNYNSLLNSKGDFSSSAKAVEPKALLDAYKWLVCYMLKMTSEKVEKLSKDGLDNFEVKNNTQSYLAVTLSTVFAEHAILNVFHNYALEVEDRQCKEVLLKLVSLYGAWSLEKHLANLYMGSYLSGESGQYLREGIVELCRVLKPEAVALVDTLAPPDFLLNSVLGKSDGHVYQNLQSVIFSYPGALSRPNWWREVVKWDSSTPSKL